MAKRIVSKTETPATPLKPQATEIPPKPAEAREIEIEETKPISVKALQEVRTIFWSLESIIDIALEGDVDMQVVQAIRPAVERLGAIIEENEFSE